MQLKEDSSQPLYAQLTTLLKHQIESNQIKPGSRLPSEKELCSQFSVSRITVRKAMNDLAVMGLVYTVPGKGAYVSLPKLREPLKPLSGFSEDMILKGYQPFSRLLHGEVQPADDALAHKLNIPIGTEIVHISRLRMVDPNQIPVAIQTNYLVHMHCTNILNLNLERISLYETLRNVYHLKLDRAETTIAARLSTPDEARQLNLPTPSAVLISDQITYLQTGEVIEIVNSVFRSDLYQMTVIM